ncbi:MULTISPECIES: family 10 glycosylhydrolase [Niastella]|uniref:Family 10 glycosylhydrolase n=1 Tax=Niastella soli TaxID=2821487 RepID=A0ABS3YNK3_9BACT|nr:family 10 glycosylhydrolase [Niastella soli]MBO9199470.1 family 10 glycosylhydrolase [Niastella soli]
MKHLLALYLSCMLCMAGLAQHAPKREFRGAWIATYTNIDWPNRTQTPAQQRAALLTILDHHKATGITALFIQVRSQCDALYASGIEPWSADLTGTQGKAPDPSWDPMQFAIEECHKRGIEFHAWLNPYRSAGNSNNIPNFAANHVTKTHPEWQLSQGTLRILDPGIPAVRDYVTSVITDIVHRYEVDGIHFDDYFYPSPPGSGVTPFNDDSTYNADPRGFTVRADWRRDNVNLLIERVYDSIKAIKPWVKFGVSPSGIYRNSTNPAIGSATSGLEHYTSLYADTRKWLQMGWLDYLCPQVYWYIGQPGANYGVVVPWWNNNSFGRHIYIGLAGYKVNDPAQGVNWANPSMIPNEVRMNRSLPNIYGEAVYNTNSLRSTTKLGFRDSLRLFFYNKPALLPNMPWRDSIAPDKPVNVTAVKFGNDSVVLNWSKPVSSDELNKAWQFVVYRSTNPVVDTSLAENILYITTNDTTAYTDRAVTPDSTYYYVVTTTDRFHNESGASNTVSTLPPAIVCLPDTMLVLNTACSVALPDFTSQVTVQASAPVNLTQIPAAGSIINGQQDTLITLIATDVAGNADTCTLHVRTVDHEAPVIADINASPATLWPPNHTMRDVTIDYTLTDNCGAVSASLAVTSNEPATNFEPDFIVVDEHHVKLRAEKSHINKDRTYTISITATDSAGNTSTASTTVTVSNFPGENDGILTVKAYPNPSPGQFIIMTLSTSPKALSISVTDNGGTLIESRSGLPATGLFFLGDRYIPGVYYLQIKQGNSKQTIKLIKLGH